MKSANAWRCICFYMQRTTSVTGSVRHRLTQWAEFMRHIISFFIFMHWTWIFCCALIACNWVEWWDMYWRHLVSAYVPSVCNSLDHRNCLDHAFPLCALRPCAADNLYSIDPPPNASIIERCWPLASQVIRTTCTLCSMFARFLSSHHIEIRLQVSLCSTTFEISLRLLFSFFWIQ